MPNSGPLGLNVAQMNSLIGTCRREAQRIRGAVSDVNGVVASTWWRGQDADTFREDWSYNHRSRVLAVAQELEMIAGQLSRDVAAQQRTSNL